MAQVIRIQERAEAEGGFQAVVSFNHRHEYAVRVREPYTEKEEQELEWYFEQYLRFPFTDRVRARETAKSIERYGEALFQQVFGEKQVFTKYHEVLKKGLSKAQIEIAGSPRFHALHWEALKDPDLPFPLALQATLVRQNLQPTKGEIELRSLPTINLLVVVARSSRRNDVGYRTISRPLVESLRQAKVPVQVDILRPATYRMLAQHLKEMTERYGEGYYHVVHFDMHGSVFTYKQYEQVQKGEQQETSRYVYNARYGRPDIAPYEGVKAFLAFESEGQGDIDLVEASELARVLMTYKVPITILNACQSGKQVGASESSLASHLVQAGVQLVLAMRYSITVSAAELLMKTLYPQLFAGDDLSVAIRYARTELYNAKARRAYFDQLIDLEDWLLPVVYQNQQITSRPRKFTQNKRVAWLERKAQEERYTPPEPQYGFVGRDLDILHIEKRLLTRRNLLLLRGNGGAGKTTLLRHLAAWWRVTGLVDHVFYFGYDEKAWTLQQILHTIAQDIYGPRYFTDFQPLSEKAQQAMLIRELRANKHLLILDNLESITGAAFAVQHTLPPEEQQALRGFLGSLSIANLSLTTPARNCTFVLLGSRGGEEWLAKGTFEQNIYDLPGLDPEAATTLAERILHTYEVTHYREDDYLRKLLKLLDGFPLAMEVILPNLKQQTPMQLLEALQAGDVKLDIKEDELQGEGIFMQKTRSLLKCVEYSYNQLSLEAQQLLLCLAPFTSVVWENKLEHYIRSLEQQPALAHLSFERWSDVLREAKNWGLLSTHTLPFFLSVQPIFPYFLRRHLNEPEQTGVREAIKKAFRQYYDVIGDLLKDLLVSKDPRESRVGRAIAGLEYENLMTALEYALKEQVSIYYLYFTLSRYLEAMQDHQRGLELGQEVLPQLEAYPTEKLTTQLRSEFAMVIEDIAKRQQALKQYQDAEASYQQALDLLNGLQRFDRQRAGHLIAEVYQQLATMAMEQRKWEEAERYYQQVLAIYTEFNELHRPAGTYHGLGVLAEQQGKWEEAERYYQQALAIFKADNDRHGEADTYHGLGVLALGQGKWEEAERYYRQALGIYLEYHDRYRQADTYHGLGKVDGQQDKWEEAKRCFQRALAIYIEYEDLHKQADTYHPLGVLAQKQGQWEEAEGHLQRALAIRKQFNDPKVAETYGQLGLLALEQGKWEEALKYYQQALAIYIDCNDRLSQAEVYLQMGIMAREYDKWEEAEQYYQQALAIYTDSGDRLSQAEIDHLMGIVAQEQGKWEEAERYYQRSLAIYIECDNSAGQAGIYDGLGALAMEQDKGEEAERYLQRALIFYRECGNGSGQAHIYDGLGGLAMEQDKWEEAENYLQRALEIKIGNNNRFEQATTYHELGNVAAVQGRWREARTYFLKALTLDLEYRNMDSGAITFRSLARLWNASNDVSLPVTVAGMVGISVEEIEKAFRQVLEENQHGNNPNS